MRGKKKNEHIDIEYFKKKAEIIPAPMLIALGAIVNAELLRRMGKMEMVLDENR